ncbi:MAG: CBS domain-containing protein [Gammaproteobacteria bacterium]|nr:CBS domain-containing protein [Gammaproteobacteria bacterium]
MPDEPSISVTEPVHTGFWSRLKKFFTRDIGSQTDSFQSDIDDALADGRINAEVHDMLDGVLEVAELQARDIMIPRSQMVVLERDMPMDQILSLVIEVGHSRFPVIGDDKDEVVGIMLAKDMLKFVSEYLGKSERMSFDIRECLRPPVFIPESKRLNSLLTEFRSSRNHMAIVVDEYGGVAGLITIEDVLERIVGDIDDEHDVPDDIEILKEGENLYAVRALTRIEDFNQHFGVELEDKDYDTIGGLVLSELGRMPVVGDELEFEDFIFHVYKVDNRRIHTLKVSHVDGSGKLGEKTITHETLKL